MSAATTWELAPAVGQAGPVPAPGLPGAIARAGAPGRRGRDRSHLRLVPAGPQARRAGRLEQRYDGRGLVRPDRLALTRRGRLTATLLVTVAVAAIAVTVLWASTPAGPAIDHETTVSAGQTLSQIAVEQMPGVPVHQAVVQLQLTNDLSSSEVHAGQRLLIPTLP